MLIPVYSSRMTPRNLFSLTLLLSFKLIVILCELKHSLVTLPSNIHLVLFIFKESLFSLNKHEMGQSSAFIIHIKVFMYVIEYKKKQSSAKIAFQ